MYGKFLTKENTSLDHFVIFQEIKERQSEQKCIQTIG